MRIVRSGQALLTSGVTGRYRLKASLLLRAGEPFHIHFAPILPSGPAFRVREPGNPKGSPMAELLSVERAGNLIDPVLRSSTPVVFGSQLLLLYLAVLVPLVLLGGIIPFGWAVLGGTLAVIQAYLLVAFTVAHSRIHPGALGKRIQHLVTMLFFPPAGVFAADHLAADVLEDVHPLAAVLHICPEEEARRIAGAYLRAWMNPVTGEDDDRFTSCLEAAGVLVDSRGWNQEEIAGPPRPEGPESVSYCPRCHTQFLVDGGTCPDCPGVLKRTLP
ncbi:MAG: hypothetical protein ABFS42_03810 [Candidatus Krumholzibacteriota bacterium]